MVLASASENAPQDGYCWPCRVLSAVGLFIFSNRSRERAADKRSAAEAEYDRLAAPGWSPRPLKSARSLDRSAQRPHGFILPLAERAALRMQALKFGRRLKRILPD